MKSSDTIITSTQNTRVKKLILLQQKSAERRKAGLFVVEGRRELLHCLHSGYEIDTLFYCPQLLFVAPEVGIDDEGLCVGVANHANARGAALETAKRRLEFSAEIRVL